MKTRQDMWNSNPINTNLLETKNPWVADREFLEKIKNDRITLHQTIASKFIGVTTSVTYFHKIVTDKDDNMQSNSTMSSFTKDFQEWEKINNFEVLMSESINLNNEGDELAKNYIRGGQIKILPDTILPINGDYFVMEYLGSNWLFQITSVTKESLEFNSGWICEFTESNQGQNFIYEFWPIKQKIAREFEFEGAHIGTDYKTILSIEDKTLLEKFKNLYNFIGEIYTSYFFDKTLSIYLLKNVREHNPFLTQDLTHKTNDYHNKYNNQVYYDNLLNNFIGKNNIFSMINNKIYHSQALVGFQEIDYLNTIFHALEVRDREYIKYKHFTSENVNKCSIFIPTVLFGMEYVKHVQYIDNNELIFLPETFFDMICEFDLRNLPKFENSVYSSDSILISEIIGLYLYPCKNDNEKKTIMIEIKKRLMFLFERRHKLTIENLYPEYIFYLFPLLGFVISSFVNKNFNKYSKENF